MASYPGAPKYKKVLATFDKAQRRQFWEATGIDIGKQTVNGETFATFKKSLTDYREFLGKSGHQASGKATERGLDIVCAFCGGAEKQEIYVTVPKCGSFCGQCTDDLIRDVEGS